MSYSYDSASRLSIVTSPAGAFTYGYEPSSYSLVKTVAGPTHTVTNTYEASRDVLTTKENSVPSASSIVSDFTYTVNNIGQRTGLASNGTAFATSNTLAWSYNAAGEVTAADHSDNTQDRAFEYDGIGNRKKRANSLTLPGVDNYAINTLNQYTSIPSLPSAPSYDADGNLTNGPLPLDPGTASTLVWDAENRLISVTVNTVTTTYSYDAQSRRASKQVDNAPAIYYLYDGWNMIADYTIDDSSSLIQNSYSWGMDLSGSMQGAGGVGGLLAVTDHGSESTAHFFPTYDGNGNVSEYLDASGIMQAHYEYDPFGNTTVSTGNKATDFFHRFSTKPLDAETGLYYYGYRYYDPVTGRWPSRDPIGERGGVNLYGFVGNNSLFWYDFLGREPKGITLGVFDSNLETERVGADDAQPGKSHKELGELHANAYGGEDGTSGVANAEELQEFVNKKSGDDCCVKRLLIFSHGFTDHGGITFLGGGKGREDHDGSFSGKKMGEAIADSMCKECQIDLSGCSACGGGAKGFAAELAASTKCNVVGYTTGRTDNGFKWASSDEGIVYTPTWSNEHGENLSNISPNGEITEIPNSGSGTGQRPSVF